VIPIMCEGNSIAELGTLGSIELPSSLGLHV